MDVKPAELVIFAEEPVEGETCHITLLPPGDSRSKGSAGRASSKCETCLRPHS